jgi:hypothetical protein
MSSLRVAARAGKPSAMKHYWLELPGPAWFSGADIYRDYVRSVTAPSVAVELGAWKGRSTCFMGVEIANSRKPVTFHTVDHWLGTEGEKAHGTDPDVEAGRLFEVFTRNIAPIAEHVNVIRSDTAEAAGQFDDETVDFLYIDAGHSRDAVLRDLRAWYPKMKVGGLIAGDDWCFEQNGERGVKSAVLEFFGMSAARLRLHPGSAPNHGWRQWSIRKGGRPPRPAPAWMKSLFVLWLR